MNESEESGTNTAKQTIFTHNGRMQADWVEGNTQDTQDVSLSEMCPRQDTGTWEGMSSL